MNNKNNLVSIIIPCYNQGEYLPEALESLSNQTYNNWECIIVNDGSTDDTEKVASEWIKKDSRFKYYFKDNSGLSDTRNFAISKAIGIYILPLDTDDKIGCNYLKEGVEILDNTDYSVVYCEAEYFGKQNGKWHLPEFSDDNILKNNIVFCSSIFKKSDFDKTLGYNKNMIYGFEDWDLWISFLKIGCKFYKIPKVHFYYRVKENSMIDDMNKDAKKKEKMYNQIFLNHQDFFIKKIGNPILNKLELDIIKNSYSYKIGSIIMWLPYKIYELFNKVKSLIIRYIGGNFCY